MNIGDQPFTENDAMIELLAWSQNLPDWQRDAMRRIIENGKLTPDDKEELKTLSISPNAAFSPFTEDHISSGALSDTPVSLISVSNAKHVNALANDQSLDFKVKGLTVVYGDNGSGKSGYVRILKSACRSRDQNFKILRDVADTSDEPQSASLKFEVGGDSKSHHWVPDGDEHDSLPSVSIFDSRSANTHVEKTNDLAYTPFPLLLLGELSQTCTELNSFIDSKIKSIQDQTPRSLKTLTLKPTTAAGTYLNSLSKESDLKVLEALIKIEEREETELQSIEVDLAQDPAKASQRIGNQKDRFEKAILKLNAINKKTTNSEFETLKQLHGDYLNKSLLAKAASDELFKSSPLPNISSESWKGLWEAARKYSNEEAYPNGQFPNVNPDVDLCVLCQQPLSIEATSRVSNFEKFVKSTLKSDENQAQIAFVNAKTAALQTALNEDYIETVFSLVNTELDNPSLAEKLKANAKTCMKRLEEFSNVMEPTVDEPALPTNEITTLIEELNSRIIQLNAGESSPERLKIIARKNELQDRKNLQVLQDDIVAQIERLKSIESLRSIKNSNSKRVLTAKNKEVSDRLVTDALRGRFAREVQKLKIGTMPLELVKSDRNATSLFKVCFVERPREPVADVLSEGEHRCVALAAFLAELVTAKEYSGIVFDDPMSSLDHKYRKRVSKRLVEESAHRQVIIFTHDLAFLFELKREAEEQELEINFQHVKKKTGVSGHIDDELPMKAKSAYSISGSIKSELKALKGQFGSFNEVKRTIIAKGIIAELRAAWEQGIADFIYPVLGRFENGVKGNSFFKLAILNDTDVSIVKAARSRLSENLHHSSEVLNPAEVSHADMVKEVQILEAWLLDIQARQKAA